jgi:hypothetical protein
MKTRLNLAAALVAGSVALGVGQASAMPALDHAVIKTAQAAQPEQVRWVCGPWRCFWRPNYFYRPLAFYAPRPYWRPRPYWGFYRPWHRHYWGFYRPWHRHYWGFYRPWHRRWG